MTVERTENETSAKIAAKNDAMRRTMSGCTVTKGITELTPHMNDIFVKVRDFSDFTEDNDPYGEHDFGSFEVVGTKVFWKIDYYDQNLSNWCDPLDEQCQRRLTIMRADEY